MLATLAFYSKCRDHCPAPFPSFVRQKGYLHLFPLTGILSPLVFILSLLFTLFHCLNRFDKCFYTKSVKKEEKPRKLGQN